MTLLVPDRTSTELPLPIVRWLEVAWPGGMDDVETITLSGPVRLRRGRLWLRGDATMRFRLGTGYVSDIRIGYGPLTAIRGMDAFVDGTGITRVGKQSDVGPEIDQGAFLALWCQSVLFPTAWPRLPGLRWRPADDTRALVDLPFRDGIETATIQFDPDASPFPLAFEADRHRVAGGPKVPWRAEYADWHWREGVPVPTRTIVRWMDEPGPWLDMRMETVSPNEPVEEPFDRARAAIALAAAPRA
jgi:hypothetical protein